MGYKGSFSQPDSAVDAGMIVTRWLETTDPLVYRSRQAGFTAATDFRAGDGARRTAGWVTAAGRSVPPAAVAISRRFGPERADGGRRQEHADPLGSGTDRY